jgi:hypothetical protein
MEFELDYFTYTLQERKERFISLNRVVIEDWNHVLSVSRKLSLDHYEHFILYSLTFYRSRKNDLEDFPFEKLNDWYKAVLVDNEKHFKEGHNFNLFYLFKDKIGFSIQEKLHSWLIQFLLEPRESHGQGKTFLLEFLKMLEIESPDEGEWEVTAEVGRIDVLLKRNYPPSIIVIENKSNWAGDQKNQLYRYWCQAIYQNTKDCSKDFYEKNASKYKIIYLVPNEGKHYENHSILKPQENSELNYNGLPETVPMDITILKYNKDINEWLNLCLKVLSQNNHRIREYIKQYQVLINNL